MACARRTTASQRLLGYRVRGCSNDGLEQLDGEKEAGRLELASCKTLAFHKILIAPPAARRRRRPQLRLRPLVARDFDFRLFRSPPSAGARKPRALLPGRQEQRIFEHQDTLAPWFVASSGASTACW